MRCSSSLMYRRSPSSSSMAANVLLDEQVRFVRKSCVFFHLEVI